ncbi:AMP binding protein [Coprinopsis marcescibilis]|uniref:AMP binding protein n=1 Tax=Coprinopsis marcescibilis TaxID=230819 RepID=A0A5C3KTL0_COPMA|nr:AMP binding protein [Coprinopsis marcescibilis]
MTAPKIFRSPFADVFVHERSIFSHLFSSSSVPGNVGAYPATHPAFIDAKTGTTLTREHTKKLALSLGFGLRNHPIYPTTRGDKILMFSHNSFAYPIALFGSVAAGLRFSPAKDILDARQLATQYTENQAHLIFSSELGIPVVLEMFKELGVPAQEARQRIIVLPNSVEWAGGPATPYCPEAKGLLTMEDLLQLGTLKAEEAFDGEQSNETVYVSYTSGTTSHSKGVAISHRHLTSVIDITKPAFPQLDHNYDKIIGLLPFYHIYGAIMVLHLPLVFGIPVVIMSHFDPVDYCANIEKYHITVSMIIPPIMVVLSQHPAVDQFDMTSIDIVYCGAAPLGAPLQKQVQDRLQSKNKVKKTVDILQGYGLTETSPTTHLLERKDGNRKVGSVGVLLANLEARLVLDSEGTLDAEVGEPGEFWVRGPSIFKRYINNETANKNAFTEDGWFKTGDILTRDEEGYYYVVERRNEMIVYKGFEVAPADLESVLLTHPGVGDAAVVGVESVKEGTELPRAYIVHKNPEVLRTEEDRQAFALEVQTWITTQVESPKHLRGGVVVIDKIPKIPSGKIMRRQLGHKAKLEIAAEGSTQASV